MEDISALVSIVTLVIVAVGAVFVLRSLRIIHQNVNSNLSVIREANAELNEEVRKLLGREHDLQTLQEATARRADEAEEKAER